ncbi:kelch domain-containing protein 3 [Aplochiton taeniatus]
MSQKSPSLWTQLPQRGQAPRERYKHACCAYGGDVFVLGGRDSQSLRDLWRYSIVLNEWTELNCISDAAPEELEEHTMVAHQGFLYVFGGMIECAYNPLKTPLWVFDIVKQKWMHWHSKRSLSQMPGNRKGHSAVVFGSAMYIYGGYIDMRGSSQEFWMLTFDTMVWSPLGSGQSEVGPSPGPRHSHSAMTHKDNMYLFGGLRGLREQRDLWRWSSTTHTWSCLKATSRSGPSKLLGHSAVAYQDSMLLFGGGESLCSPMNCLWRYSVTTNSWEKLAVLPSSTSPPHRIHHGCAGLGPSYQPRPTSPLIPTSINHGLQGKLRPFKNKCFPSTWSSVHQGTEGAIELETFSLEKSNSQTLLTDRVQDYCNGLIRKDASHVGNCLTYENKEAFCKQWDGEDGRTVALEEESMAHHLPDLMLVVGGKPLTGHTAISVWQMTLTDL